MDSTMTHCTIQSNSSMASIMIRFRLATEVKIQDGSMESSKKAKPKWVQISQLGDMTQAHEWKEKQNKSNNISPNIS